MSRRNLYIPDELYAKIERAAAEAGAREGKGVSVSEYIRRACLEKMGRVATGQR